MAEIAARKAFQYRHPAIRKGRCSKPWPKSRHRSSSGLPPPPSRKSASSSGILAKPSRLGMRSYRRRCQINRRTPRRRRQDAAAFDRLEEEVSKYVQVKRAIMAKEQELKDIYEIQKSASTLTALIETHQRKQEEFEKDVETEREELSAEIEQMRARWAEEKKEHEAEIKARLRQTKAPRSRAGRISVCLCASSSLPRINLPMRWERLPDLEEQKAAADKDLAERQREIASREDELSQLRRKSESFPAELQSAVAKAVADAVSKGGKRKQRPRGIA